MAFRLGHQITCTINKNIFIRSSSADSSHRYKSLSPICFNRKLNESRCLSVKGKKISIFRARSLPSPEDNFNNSPCKRFCSNKHINSEFEESGYNEKLTTGGITEGSNKQPKRINKIRLEAKISNTGLQPSNLIPIACTTIHHTSSPRQESARSIKIDTLKRLASAQYEKAVKVLNQHSKDETCRYQLEAAKPKQDKDNSAFNVHELYKKKHQSVAAKAPQLQPKNIKPYGNINTLPWCAPNVEYNKKSVSVNKYQKHVKPSNINEPEIDNNKTVNHIQQRDYCTVNKNEESIKISRELQQCKAIVNEYKKINPEYIEKKLKFIPGSEEEKKFMEQAERFVLNIKSIQEKNELCERSAGLNTESVGEITSDISKEENSREKQEFSKITDLALKSPPKISLQQSGKGKVILYYDEKNGNKILCSRVVKDINAENLNEKINKCSEKESEPIKVKVAPKLMLQSSNLKDSDQFGMEELTLAANEKFATPWLSWGDRVKLDLERHKHKIIEELESGAEETCSHQQPSLRKSNTILVPNAANDTAVNKQSEIQKREFSVVSHKQKLNSRDSSTFCLPEEGYFNWEEMWNKTNGRLRADEILFRRSFDSPLLALTTNRSFSTNSTRGVLGPEGTVMVKLRRLPKINIPEPSKVCPEPSYKSCIRADGTIKIKQKKLPKLSPGQCRPPPKSKMKNIIPLARLKSRGEPPDPLRICPESGVCTRPRADGHFRSLPKKLPKLVPSDCFPCLEHKMTSPPLPRLKARPIPPPPPCKDIAKVICPCRADEGLKVTRKKLPGFKLSGCCPVCKPEMSEGEPLRRLRKAVIPEPKRVCIDIKEECPPRADEVCGYTIKRKKLQTIILSEKYNNLSWKEFNSKLNKTRTYATDSKCSMCCYSNKEVHPDIILKGELVPSAWDKFDGQLISESDGKIKAYLPPEKVIDTSTGMELKITRKSIGSSYRKDDHFHEELLKSGFTTFNNHDRKFSSLTSVLCGRVRTDYCAIAPDKPVPKDLRLKPLKKRKDFDKDFPPRLRFQQDLKDKECCSKCTTPRMDDIMKYEVKAKSLPILPKGTCLHKKKPIPKHAPPLLRRLKKKMRYREYDCPKMCIEKCPPRADDNLIETPKKLPPMIMSKCPEPIRRHARDDDARTFKRLPKVEDVDPPRRQPGDCLVSCRQVERSDIGKDFYERKSLPKLVPSNCPPKPRPKPKSSMKFTRLPKPPFYDREDDCRTICEKIHEYRSDVINNYQVKMKKLKVILKSSNRSFTTLPDNFIYQENFSDFRLSKYISTSAHLLASDKKECKKLGKTEKKHVCPKFKVDKCKPVTSISCKKHLKSGPECSKQKSPYPAFSECKDHSPSDIITECKETEKHLQPRWPILNEIINQKPPPPHQGKIDPTKEEECIARKLNFKMEGETKTCENFNKPYKPALTKEMYDEVVKNPPYDECECANEDEKPSTSKTVGPCKPVEHSICKTPDIECTLDTKSSDNLACIQENKEPKAKKAESSEDNPKLTCKKKLDANSGEDKKGVCKGMETTSRKVEKKEEVKDESDEVKHDKKEEKEGRKQPCQQPQVKQCKQKSDSDCQTKRKICEDEKKTAKSGDSKKDHCRQSKPCQKKEASTRKMPKKCSDLLKEDKIKKKAEATKKKPKKCSDLLKEDKKVEATQKKSKKCSDLLKEDKKAEATQKKPKKCSDLLKEDKKTEQKVEARTSVSCPAIAPKCPAKRSLLQRFLDFFRAKPNCPAPDQWKKDKLRKQAEKAAAAAGYELCEKKKPKVVKVVCKKTGIRGSKQPNSKSKQKKDGTDKGCKRFKSTYAVFDQSENAYLGSSTQKKDYCSKSKDKSDSCKIASVVKAKECPPDSAENCIQEETTEKHDKPEGSRSSKRCNKLPKQKYCKPRARKDCREDMVERTCTTVLPPYPSFSECKKRFARLPITECTEQEKNTKRKSVTYDYDDPKKGARNYSTTMIQKRMYSSGSNGRKGDDLLSFLNITENSLKDIENQELALRILTVVKDCMQAMASSNHNARETYFDIFKELELLCEEELNKNLKKEILSGSRKKLFSPYEPVDLNLYSERSLLTQKDFSDIEDTIMIDAIKKFCKILFSVPDLSTQTYEESERIKTERLQKKLDEILDNYKMQ